MTMYADPADIEDLIPPELLVEALDDDADGEADAGRLQRLIAAAARLINGKLARRYRVPIDVTSGDGVSPAAWLKNATIYIAVSIAYGRRGMEERYPYKTELEDILEELQAIANGDQPLFPEMQRVNDSAEVISEKSRVHSRQQSA